MPRIQNRARETLRVPLAVLILPLALVGGAGTAEAATPARTIDASVLVRAIETGRPVLLEGVVVSGDVRLPRVVDVPVIARNVTFLDDVLGAHATFSRVVDLSDSTIRGRVEFQGARFDAPFVFERADNLGGASFALAVFRESARFGTATFDGRADFSGAQLHGEARFDEGTFTREADFSLAGFDGAASFVATAFDGETLFTGAEFSSIADFTAVTFRSFAGFREARFGARADFINAEFEGDGHDGASVDFTRASFDGGARFVIADVRGNAVFVLASASEDLDFQGAEFLGIGRAARSERPVLNFSTAHVTGAMSFAEAILAGPANFDQAFVAELDLGDAVLEGALQLPLGPESGGRLGSLRLDLEDAAWVDGPGDDEWPAQKAALDLVERSARDANDLATANDARLRRSTLARHRKGLPREGLDLAINYGIWGYGVRPFHQLIAIGLVIGIGLVVRGYRRRRPRATWPGRLRGAIRDVGDSLGALLRLHPPEGGWNVLEFLVFKLLTVIFVLNAANVWPVSRELIEGVF